MKLVLGFNMEKLEKLSFLKTSEIFLQIISYFFFWNMMRVIGLRLQLIAVNLTKVGTK